jgi:hypothetical protein
MTTEEGLALGHMSPHVTMFREACTYLGGLSPNNVEKWVFTLCCGLYFDFMPVRILPIFGGYWALFEPRFWEEVGMIINSRSI